VGMLSEPGSMVFDSGRPALVAGGAGTAGGSSVPVCGAGAPDPELDRTEGGGSVINQHAVIQSVNTHRQRDDGRPFFFFWLTPPLRVGSDEVWVRNTPVASVGLDQTMPAADAAARRCRRRGATGFVRSCK